MWRISAQLCALVSFLIGVVPLLEIERIKGCQQCFSNFLNFMAERFLNKDLGYLKFEVTFNSV